MDSNIRIPLVIALVIGLALTRFDVAGHLAAKIPHLYHPISDYLARIGCEADPGNPSVWYREQNGLRTICDVDYDYRRSEIKLPSSEFILRPGSKMALDATNFEPAKPIAISSGINLWQYEDGHIISTVGISNPHERLGLFSDDVDVIASDYHSATMPENIRESHADYSSKAEMQHLFDAAPLSEREMLFGTNHQFINKNNLGKFLSLACPQDFYAAIDSQPPYFLPGEYDFCMTATRRR